jgi:hypothetical protein
MQPEKSLDMPVIKSAQVRTDSLICSVEAAVLLLHCQGSGLIWYGILQQSRF